MKTPLRARTVHPLRIFVVAVVVVGISISVLLLFIRSPSSQVGSANLDPLPALTQPPVLRDQSQSNDDPSAFLLPTFALDQAAIYATDGLHSIYTLQASTGAQQRRISTHGIADWSVLARNGILYTFTRGTIEARNTDSGSLRWTYTVSSNIFNTRYAPGNAVSIVSPLVIANGILYVCASPGGGDYAIYTLQANDGTPLWSHDLNLHTLPQPLTRISVIGGVIYVVSSYNPMIALRAKDGSVLWSDGPGGVTSLPAVANGIVYVSVNTQVDLGPHLNDFAAVSVATGKVLWHYPLSNSGPYGSAVVVGNTVYVGSDENIIYAFDAHSNKLKWSRSIDQLHGLPRNDDKNVFVGSVSANTLLVGSEDGYVVALQTDTGALRWYYQTNGLYTSPTVVQGDRVYVQSNYPNTAAIALAALNIQSGQPAWSASLGMNVGPTMAAPSHEGITPHLPGVPSFTVGDVKQYLKMHTTIIGVSPQNTTGTPTITFTDYKNALSLIDLQDGNSGSAGSSPADKEVVCIVIWKTVSNGRKTTTYILFSANTGRMLEGGSSGEPA